MILGVNPHDLRNPKKWGPQDGAPQEIHLVGSPPVSVSCSKDGSGHLGKSRQESHLFCGEKV